MIVCVCNNISEGKIHQAVQAGMRSMSELRQELGVGTACGKCNTCAKHVLRTCLQHAHPPVHQTRHSVQTMLFLPNPRVA